MSEKSSKEATDINRLEAQIENLRSAVTVLIVAILLLFGYTAILSIQQSSQYIFLAFFAIILLIVLMNAYDSSIDKE